MVIKKRGYDYQKVSRYTWLIITVYWRKMKLYQEDLIFSKFGRYAKYIIS